MNITNLLKIDAELSEKIRNAAYSSFVRQVMSILAHSADSWYWGIVLAALWLIGPRAWRGDIQLLFIGIVLTALFIQGLKFFIKRPRPEGEWGQIYRSSDPHSFPSGHAARAIMLTTIMLLSGYIWLGLLMIFWTLLVAAARVGLGVHYLSDIVVGTAIGAFFGGLLFLIFG
jgi:undecaprenyl-diphosphatase